MKIVVCGRIPYACKNCVETRTLKLRDKRWVDSIWNPAVMVEWPQTTKANGKLAGRVATLTDLNTNWRQCITRENFPTLSRRN